MGKNAYLIVPDLHLGDVLTVNRISYRREIEHVQTEMFKVAMKYRKLGWSVKVMLLGDVFHNSYKSVFPAIVDHDFFVLWRERIGDCYSLVGNHELTYYKSNPFYTLISTIESERLQQVVNKVWQPLGAVDVLRVVDSVQDGEVTFYFNHYGTGIQRPGKVGVAIGLFHQDVIDRSILKQVEKERETTVFTKAAVDMEGSQLFSGYKYCFFGHMHLAYGSWKMGDTVLRYLASLGRTNVLEVRDDFLERCIPVVKVEDGIFAGVDENYFNLLKRSECVREDVVLQQHVEEEKKKVIAEMRSYTPMGDDPVKNLEALFAGEPGVLVIMEDLLKRETDRRFDTLNRKLRFSGIEN